MNKAARKKKTRRIVKEGRAYIKATFNNTILTFTDRDGNVIVSGSGGSTGFKGSRKSTPYAAQVTTTAVCEKAKKYGLEKVDVFVRGIGSGRESVIRAISSGGIYVNSIKDVTPIPHNGCRPKKPRRV